MDRRAFVRGLVGFAAAGTVAGCGRAGEVPETAAEAPAAVRDAQTQTPVEEAGGDGDGDIVPTSAVSEDDPLRANDIVFVRGNLVTDDEGNNVVTFTFRNDGLSRSAALVRVWIRDDDGEEVQRERFVELEPGETTTIRFSPDHISDDFGGYDVELLAETPATSIPSATPTASPTATGTPTATETESAAAGESDE